MAPPRGSHRAFAASPTLVIPAKVGISRRLRTGTNGGPYKPSFAPARTTSARLNVPPTPPLRVVAALREPTSFRSAHARSRRPHEAAETLRRSARPGLKCDEPASRRRLRPSSFRRRPESRSGFAPAHMEAVFVELRSQRRRCRHARLSTQHEPFASLRLRVGKSFLPLNDVQEKQERSSRKDAKTRRGCRRQARTAQPQAQQRKSGGGACPAWQHLASLW